MNLKKADKDASLEYCFICFRNTGNDQSRYKEHGSYGNVVMETDTGIKWSDKVRNADVLHLVQGDRAVTDTTKSRKQRWIGHVLRHKGMFRDVTEGRLLRKRSTGRRRTGHSGAGS